MYRTVHFDSVSFFRSVPPSPLLTTPPPVPALAYPLCRHPCRQPAPSGTNCHWPSHRPAPHPAPSSPSLDAAGPPRTTHAWRRRPHPRPPLASPTWPAPGAIVPVLGRSRPAPRTRQHPRPTRPRHPPLRKPDATGPHLPEATTTASSSDEGVAHIWVNCSQF
jgi:hypothetical protein